MDPVFSLLNEFKNLNVCPNNGYIKKISKIVEVDLKDMTNGKKTTFFGRKTTFFRRKKIKVINDKGISKKGI